MLQVLVFRVRTSWVTVSTAWHIRKMGKNLVDTMFQLSPRYVELRTETGESWFCSGWTRKTSADAQNCGSVCVCQVGAISWKICEDCPVNLTVFFLPQVKKLPRKQLWPYRVAKVQQLEPDKQERVHYCKRWQDLPHTSPGILDITWFSDEAWFHILFF